MIRQFLLDYSNFQVNSNVDLTASAILLFSVKLNRFQVDWNCAYAVYGQVEKVFG